MFGRVRSTIPVDLIRSRSTTAGATNNSKTTPYSGTNTRHG